MQEKCWKMLSLTSELLFYTHDCLEISLKSWLYFARKWLHFLPSTIGPIKKMKTVLERSDQVLSNEPLTYVKCSLFFHMNIATLDSNKNFLFFIGF